MCCGPCWMRCPLPTTQFRQSCQSTRRPRRWARQRLEFQGDTVMSNPAKQWDGASHLTPQFAEGVRIQPDQVSGKPALLYPEGVLLLNPTGAAIVELCDGRRTFGEILAALALRFQAPAEVLSGDVAEYLGKLCDRGLVKPLVDQ